MRVNYKKLLSITAVTSLLLSGCGGAGGEGDSSTEKKESSDTVALTVWCAEEDNGLMNQIISGFQAQHSDIAFEFTVNNCAEGDCKNTLLGDVNNAPDVFTFSDDQLATFAASGVLKPIENPDDIISRNAEGSVAAASLNDELYAYPLTADNGYFLYYNKAYLSESDVATMDGILDVASSNGKKFTMDWSSGWYLYSFFGNTGLEVGINDDGISNYCTWNSTEGNIKGVDVANAMIAIGQNPGFQNGGDDALKEGAANGTVIAGVSGVWVADDLKAVWGDNLGAVKLPTYTCAGQQVQMSSYAGYKLIGVNSYSKNKEWASKFADWVSNEENQKLRFEMRSQGPSNINAAASPEVKESVALSAVMSQAEHSKLQRVGATYWEPVVEFGQAMANNNTNGLSLQDYMDEMVKKITASNS